MFNVAKYNTVLPSVIGAAVIQIVTRSIPMYTNQQVATPDNNMASTSPAGYNGNISGLRNEAQSISLSSNSDKAILG